VAVLLQCAPHSSLPPALCVTISMVVIDLSSRSMAVYRIGCASFRFCAYRSYFISFVMKYVVLSEDFMAFSRFPSPPAKFAMRNGSGGGPRASFPQRTYTAALGKN